MPAGSPGGDGEPLSGTRRLSTPSEYPYGCDARPPPGSVAAMTTHRFPEPPAGPALPVRRAMNAALVLSVVAGLGWTVGMIYTLASWNL